MQSDDSLIKRAQRGDLEAFEALVYRYDRRVLSLAMAYTQNEDEAKDVYQEVFMRVHRALPGFRFRSQFSTWLHRIAVNACYTHRRRVQAREFVSLDAPREGDDPSPYEQRIGSEPTGEALLLNQELSQQIRSALEDLSPKQRLVFILRHYHDFKLREIASLLRCAEGTVKRHLFTATQRLRQRLRTEWSEGT